MNDQLLHDADPYDASRVPPLDGADAALLDEILATPDARLRDWRPARTTTLRGRLVTAVAVAASLTVAVAVPTVIASLRDDAPLVGGTPPITYAASVVKVAEANPRLLVDAPGWAIHDVDGFDPDYGQVRFQVGQDGDNGVDQATELVVIWRPAAKYQEYLDDRADESAPQRVEVAGSVGTMFTYNPDDHTVLLPPDGSVFLELRGSGDDEAAYKALLTEHVKAVGVQEWLDAMPREVVTAGSEGAALAAALVGVPVPPGFDPGTLSSTGAEDSYDFGVRVTGAVACGWFDRWTVAHRAGDRAGMDRAARAMATSHGWQVLLDMDAEGDWPEAIWETSDLISAGKVPVGYVQGLGCEDFR